MLCVDRIIASACFDTGNVPAVRADGGYSVPAGAEGECSESWKEEAKCSKKKGGGMEIVECRICQEEGFESDMESPCACCGKICNIVKKKHEEAKELKRSCLLRALH